MVAAHGAGAELSDHAVAGSADLALCPARVNQDAASAKAARALAVQIMLRSLYVPGKYTCKCACKRVSSLSAASARLLALQNASKTQQLQGASTEDY